MKKLLAVLMAVLVAFSALSVVVMADETADTETVVDENNIKSLNEVDFYKKQQRIALVNCGVINQEEIDEYIGFNGYIINNGLVLGRNCLRTISGAG